MAVKFPFVSAFLCERVLVEQDNIASAIRIVDIFQVPEGAAQNVPIQFYAFVALKALPVPNEEVNVGVTLVKVSGERQPLPGYIKNPLKLWDSNSDPSIPGGVSLIMQMQIVPKNFGVCYLEVEIDGEIAVTIPFTIRPARTTLPVVQPQ